MFVSGLLSHFCGKIGFEFVIDSVFSSLFASVGPPDIYTDESLHKRMNERKVTLDKLAEMHPDILFPEPLQALPPEPLEPLYGGVMLNDLPFTQLLMHLQPAAYFYPDTPTDESTSGARIEGLGTNAIRGREREVPKKRSD